MYAQESINILEGSFFFFFFLFFFLLYSNSSIQKKNLFRYISRGFLILPYMTSSSDRLYPPICSPGGCESF